MDKEMKKILAILLGIISFNSTSFAYDFSILQSKIDNVKSECSGIKSSLDTIFGLSVATTVSSGIGTLTSTGALVAGLKKRTQDYKLDEETLHNDIDRFIEDYNALTEDIKNSMKKSETLGNVRSALLAGTTVTSAVSTGTSIGTTLTASKLAEKMSNCNKSLQALKIAKSSTESETEDSLEPIDSTIIEIAKNILSTCIGYDESNIKSLKNFATANAVVSGIGTGISGVGTATSIMANKTKDKEKNKKLDTASNILSGVAIGTSGTSTTLSAIQISKAKKDSSIAEKCENILR